MRLCGGGVVQPPGSCELSSSSIVFVSLQICHLDLSLHLFHSTSEAFLSLRVTIPHQRATEGSIKFLIHICKSAHVRAEMQH